MDGWRNFKECKYVNYLFFFSAWLVCSSSVLMDKYGGTYLKRGTDVQRYGKGKYKQNSMLDKVRKKHATKYCVEQEELVVISIDL